MKTYELRRGRKVIYGLPQPDGFTDVITDCDEFPLGIVKFKIPNVLARKLFDPERREHVQDIAPEMPKELREIFISGTTPAEFDALRGELPKNIGTFMEKYKPFGYTLQ